MPRPDPAWLDAQYNARAGIADATGILGRWGLASALARDKLKGHLDIPYGGAPTETLDLFAPAIAGAESESDANGHANADADADPDAHAGAPILVFIHGGWWRSLDKRDHSFVAPAFTHAGAMVVIPNYALCPAVTIDAICLQMVRALAWVYRHASRYGGDPARIVVAGHSAGGHLAAMMLSCRWNKVAPDLPARLVTSALSISGLFDLEPLRHAPFLQPDIRLSAESATRLSPARFAAPGGTLLATVGAHESEEFLRQSRLIRDAWGPATVPACEPIADANHFSVLHGLADPQARLHRLAAGLLGLAHPVPAEPA